MKIGVDLRLNSSIYNQRNKQISHRNRAEKRNHNLHLHRPIPTSTNHLIRHKIHTIHFIRMTRKVRLDLICIQIPYLAHQKKIISTSLPRTHKTCEQPYLQRTILTRTNQHPCIRTPRQPIHSPLSVATNFPIRPSQTRTAPSHPADAAHRPSGKNATWLIWRWCPIRQVRGLVLEVFGCGCGEGKGDQSKRVWSSEPEMRSSGVLWRRAVYRTWASCWAR
jgi:hypothetical protein